MAHDVGKPSQPGTQWSDAAIVQAVAPMRVGRKLTPKDWPGGAKVAVCLSWDMDNESCLLASGNTAPVLLSAGEYGNAQGLRRILDLYDRHRIPGSFFVPAAVGLIYPNLVEELKRRPQHEIGIHGWIHENPATLNDREEEQRLLRKSIDFWTGAWGQRPSGYRAPFWEFSAHTLDLIRAARFEYDSSAMGMDEPYELVSNGQATGIVELPVSWSLDDAHYFWLPGGALPSPRLAFEVFREEFDGAYQEGTLFMLTMHPMITGQRARIGHLDKLISYMKAKGDVWFATAHQISRYVRQQGRLQHDSL